MLRAAAQLRPRLTAAALRRRALAARSGARRACSSRPSDFYVDEAHWPLYGGAVLAVGCLIGGLVVRRESFLRKAQSKVALPPGGIMASEVSVFGLGGLSVAFMLTQLPVDELRVRLLGNHDALRKWAALAACYDLEQQQIALGALTSLLSSDAALDAFDAESAAFSQLSVALPPLVHGSPSAVELDGEVLLDAMSLAVALIGHPMFAHTDDDGWLWEKLLEHTAAQLDWQPSAALAWACAAAACAEKPNTAERLLECDEVKRALVRLADDPEAPLRHAGDPLEVEVDGADEPAAADRGWRGWVAAEAEALARLAALERDYARLALSRLAQAAAAQDTSELTEEEVARRHEPFYDEYSDVELPACPVRPPTELAGTPRVELLARGLTSAAACAISGAVWGTLRGCLKSARARRPVWRSAVLTAAGAVAFEVAMQAKYSAVHRIRAGRAAGGLVPPSPPYRTTLRLAGAAALDVAVSSQLLWLVVQPARAPFAFGGWLLGRAVVLSDEMVDVDIDMVD